MYTMELYSAIRKSKTMWFEDKWIELEGMILSEVIQVQKDKGPYFLYKWKTDPKVNIYIQKQT
jgi:hypothetical protein